MRKFIGRAGLATVLALASATAITTLTPAYSAQRNDKDAKKDEGPKVRREVGIPLGDALKLINSGDLDGAMAKLQQADMVEMKTPFEDYSIAEYIGAVAIKKMDYAAATAAFNRQVASGGAPDEKKEPMLSTAMKLNYQAMDFPKVVQDSAELQKLRPLDDQEGLILTQSLYNSMDYTGAIQAAKNVLDVQTKAGMKPNPDLLAMILNAQIKTKDDAGYRQTLDQLALVSDKPEVWGQEVDNVFATKGLADHQLLNLYRLSLLVGTIKDQDYAAMATIDLQNGLPNEAKTILTKGNKPGDLLTQANGFVAKDQASLPQLAQEAAKQTNGEVDVKLGESYYSYGQYDMAIAAIQKGLEKGGLKDMADAQTTLGIVLLAAGKKDEATQAFDKAAMAQTPSAAVAHVWSIYSRRQVAA